MVKERVAENPVYVVYSASGEKQKTRTLHRDLLLLVNDLPLETPPQSTKPAPEKTDQDKVTDNKEWLTHEDRLRTVTILRTIVRRCRALEVTG